jgi:hypothetical protein
MAVLAATASGATLEEAASAMVRVREELTPDPSRTARLTPVYLGFVDELTRRGLLEPAVAEHARGKAER